MNKILTFTTSLIAAVSAYTVDLETVNSDIYIAILEEGEECTLHLSE